MSDVGINFPPWFGVAILLAGSLPFTTAILAGLAIAWFGLRRRSAGRSPRIVRWSALAVAPFWLGGLALNGLWLVSEINREIYGAQHYFKLHAAAEVDGIRLPAGTQVTLYEDGALGVAELPEGATAARHGATWQGKLEFAMPAQAPNGKHGQITTGTLAAPSIIDGIPCEAGPEVHFFSDGTLMYCTLSADTTVGAAIRAADRAATTQHFRCRAANSLHLQGASPSGQLENCTLAAPAQIGPLTCADNAEVRIWNGNLDSCTLAKPVRFGPLDLPAGSKVTYYDGAPNSFALPQAGDAIDGFGLRLPPGAEAFFCAKAMALRQLNVDRSRYVAIAGVKLTGDIEFDCGKFQSGQLFEDAMVGGSQRRAGDLVTQAELFP